MNMPGCVCWGSENLPILKDALGKKTTHIEGFLCILHTILLCDIKLKCIIPKGHSNPSSFLLYLYSVCWL